MADVAVQDRPGAAHDATTTTTPQDDHAAAAPVRTLRAMLARGLRNPAEIAALLFANPYAQHELLAILHALAGNAFVQAVVAAVQGGAGKTVAPEAAQPHAPAKPHLAAPTATSVAMPGAGRIPLGPVRVTSHGLRVRRTLDTATDDNILGGLHQHAEVIALAHEGAWIRIDYHGEAAFIHGKYVEPVARPIADAAAAPAMPEAHHDAAPAPVHIADPVPTAPANDPIAVHPDPAPVKVTTPAPPTHAPMPPVAATPDASLEPAKLAPLPVPPPKPGEDKHVAPVKDKAPRPEQAPDKQPDPQVKQVDTKVDRVKMFSRVYTTSVKGKPHYTQVFVSPGAITATPNVAVYFHGYDAQYGIGDKGSGVVSGIDVAAEAVAQARNQNTIAILPQGNIGRNDEQGGHMAVLEAGLPAFLTSILGPLAADLHMDSLAPGNISLSGHSAGGYEGMAHALHGAGALADSITDVTLMDSDYADAHYAEAVKWMFQGKPATPAKNLRIIEQASQLAPTEKLKPDAKRKPHINYHDPYFKPANLTALAAKHGCTVDHVHVEAKDTSADVRDTTNTVVQHSRVMKDGKLQVDVLIMRSSLSHQALRDSVLDDAILSVGEGDGSNDTFGTHHVAAKDSLKKARTAEAAGGGASQPVKPVGVAALESPKINPEQPKAEPKPEHTAAPVAAAPSGAPRADHTHKGYDRDKNGLDSYGNATERSWSRAHNTVEAGKHVFVNSFTTIEDATLYQGPTGKAHLPHKLPKGTKVHAGDVTSERVQLITSDIKETDNVWISFSSLGGHGASIGFGNEKSDAADKQRADAIRSGLPTSRKPGESKFKWKFGAGFHPALDGVALDGSLMSKVHALMEWAIYNDMVLGDIVIGSGMRSPHDAHFMCVRYEIARNGMQNVSMENLKKLKDGRDADGNKWYEPGWTKDQVIAHAESLYGKGGKGAVAAAGYNFGDAHRAPLDIGSGPGVSRHCSGHAVDVDIPWRSENAPEHTSDVWAWEQVYHQFGLTRPLHKDRGGKKSTQESWHIEETGKGLQLEEDA